MEQAGTRPVTLDGPALLAGLEDRSLPLASWTHQAHLQVATACLAGASLDEATDRFAHALRAYNVHHALEGFHETLTRAYMALVARAVAPLPADAPAPLREACAVAACHDKRVILDHFARERIMSDEARAGLVAPDRPYDDPGLPLEVREATDADEPAAVAAMVVLQEDLRAFDPLLIPGWEMARGYLGYLHGRVAGQDGRIFLAMRGRAAMGFLCVWIERGFEPLESTVNEHAYVSDLVVFPAARRLGVAQALLAAAEAHARAHGMTQLHLNVLARNAGAVSLYERSGFAAKRLAMVKPLGTREGIGT